MTQMNADKGSNQDNGLFGVHLRESASSADKPKFLCYPQITQIFAD
jgi:hypothetical protein